jgi:regulatory protein
MPREITALQKAVELLARREHSQHELRNKLFARGFAEHEIDAALQTLVEKDLQSDERFTEAWISARVQRGHGPYRITAELKQHGVDEHLIDRTMRTMDIDWFDHALNVYRKKYGQSPVSDYQDKAKRSRFLQQRGFSSEHIQHALESVGDADS